MKWLLSIFTILLFINCTQTKQMNYTYADGSGNTYTLVGKKIRYNPIQPKESSSGTYSGGEKKEVSINETEQKKIVDLFQKAIDNKKIHMTQRQMGTGMIRFMKEKNMERIIIPMRSKEKNNIESFLKSLLNI